MMRHTLYIGVVLFMLSSCAKKTSPVAETLPPPPPLPAERDHVGEGFVPATVFDSSGLDGCGFMIKKEDDSKLLPLNLKEELRKDGLKVWIKYGVKKDAMTTCMAGQAIMLSEILERK